MKPDLGEFEIASFPLKSLERAVIHSFEARRGALFQTLCALNALAVRDLGINAMQSISFAGHLSEGSRTHLYTTEDADALVHDALKRQLDPEVFRAFRFEKNLRKATTFLGGAQGITSRLETIVPPFIAEFKTRELAGDIEPRTGLLRWLIGTGERGRIEPLLEFANASLFFAPEHLTSAHENQIKKRLEALRDRFPR